MQSYKGHSCVCLPSMKGTLKQNESIFGNLKQDIQHRIFLRRYQKILSGDLPWEEKLAVAFEKVAANLALSWRRAVKRTLDALISTTGLMLISPVLVLIAIAIKLDSRGPVVFKQARVGMRGKVFTMLKFRTMRQDAEAKTGPVWASEQDPRVTRVGQWLRVAHLDELPQLVNVFKGEMSIVGPRPERPYFVNEFRKLIPHYERRLCVKPGITGLAQIKRGYDQTLADVKKKLKYDILYIQRMCPLVDVKVLGMTVGAVLSKSGR